MTMLRASSTIKSASISSPSFYSLIPRQPNTVNPTRNFISLCKSPLPLNLKYSMSSNKQSLGTVCSSKSDDGFRDSPFQVRLEMRALFAFGWFALIQTSPYCRELNHSSGECWQAWRVCTWAGTLRLNQCWSLLGLRNKLAMTISHLEHLRYLFSICEFISIMSTSIGIQVCLFVSIGTV